MKRKIFMSFFLLVSMIASSRIYLGVETDELETIYPDGDRELVLTLKPNDLIDNFFYDPAINDLFIAVRRGKRQFIESKRFKSKGYQQIINFGFLTESKKPYYITSHKERYWVHIGSQKFGPYEGVGYLAASVYDDFIAYQISKGDKVAIVYNNSVGRLYDEIGYAVISPSGHYSYRAQKGDLQLLVIDGVEHSTYQEYGSYSYGEYGEDLYYTARNSEGWVIIKNNDVLAGPFDEVALLAISSKGKDYIAAVKVGNNSFVVVNGKSEKLQYEQIISIHISDDGKSYAYGVIKEGLGAYVLNGIEEGFYDDLYFLMLQDNPLSYGYHAKKNGRWFFINNGVEEESYEALMPQPIERSQDGTITTFWIHNKGKTLLAVKNQGKTIYYRNIIGANIYNNHLFLLIKEQQNIYRVRIL